MIFPNPSQLGKPQKPSEASQYLPGGQKYQQSLVESAKNPRQGVPVSKWISTWDADDAQEEAEPASVKAPDELQRELMMLEDMSKPKRETDDRKPDGGNQKTSAKDNK